MPVPFEALLPYGVMLTLITIGGGGLSVIHAFRNGGKRDRTRLDQFERQLMERDFRLTGSTRGQNDAPVAPEAFKTNSFNWLQRNPL